jgi:hypothetical protein
LLTASGACAISMETHIFFRGKLPTRAALSRAMKELGFPFSISPSTGSLEQQSGFMPMKRRGEETGVEFDVYSDHAAVEEFAHVGVDAGFERRASLRWGGDFQEAVAGMSAAAALAKLMNGVVFDEAEDRLLSADEAIAVAGKNMQELVKPEDAKHPGTRPADLKRYLRPLLKQRSDLVLIGRLLIIRPVRHIVRGVFFDRTSDKYEFRVYRYVHPLWLDNCNFFRAQVQRFADWHVWAPYFKPFLFDVLAEDVFAQLGTLTTLEACNDDRGDNREMGFGPEFSISALILAGRRERAAELTRWNAGVPAAFATTRIGSPGRKSFWSGISHLSAPIFDPGRARLRVAFNSATPGCPRRLPSKCLEQNERGRPTNRCFRPSPGSRARPGW